MSRTKSQSGSHTHVHAPVTAGAELSMGALSKGVSGKGQHAYDQLRRRILTMELPPSVPLREAELLKLIGVGRTPLREAIQRLAAEKLIVAWPRQTPYVAPIHAHELVQIVEMRYIVEVPVARFAAMRATDEERASLQAACRRFERAVTAGDTLAIVEADELFHNTAAMAARNSYLLDTSKRVTGFSGRLWRLSASRSSNHLQHTHDELTAAIVEGVPDRAAAAAAEHIEFFQKRLRRLLDPSSELQEVED